MKPSDLIYKRNEAFKRGDFGFIFDSYHSDANFRRQFAGRDEYLQVGQSSLSRDFSIVDCRVLKEWIEGCEAQVIFVMEMEVEGQLQTFAELTWLKVEGGNWKYHSGLKVTGGDLPDNPDELTFEFFAGLDHSTVF